MLIDNKISRFLPGPYIFFGSVFLLGSVTGIITKNWIMLAVNLPIAWYLFATISGIDIDTSKQKFRTYNKHFGLFKTGKWQAINQYIGLTLVPMNNVYKMYSRSNRVNTSIKKEFRIYLVGKNKKPALPVKICKTSDDAQNRMDELALWLHLPVFSVKH